MNPSSPKIRAFVALYPEAPVARRLEVLQEDLRKRFPGQEVRWTRPEQLHLTLQFLGYIQSERVAEFETAIASVSEHYPSIRLVAERLGCFPGRKAPRILWAGLSGDVEILQKMKADLDRALAPAGYVPEKREFHPHLTLARIGELKRKEIEQLDAQVVSHEAIRFGEWRAERIDLMQSVLSSAGANYSVLRSFPLVAKK